MDYIDSEKTEEYTEKACREANASPEKIKEHWLRDKYKHGKHHNRNKGAFGKKKK